MAERSVTARIKNIGNVQWTFYTSMNIDGGQEIEGTPLLLSPGQEGTVGWKFDDSNLMAGEHTVTVSVWKDRVGGTKLASASAKFTVAEKVAAEIVSVTVS